MEAESLRAHTALRHGFTDTADGQIHFLTAGEGNPLVLLPHGGRSSRMYRELALVLSRHCKVVALDPPGTGESFLPDEPRTIPELAETLHQAAIATAGPLYTLYGMNGGNKLGAAIAAAHPEAIAGFIFAGLTHSIVLSNDGRGTTLGKHPSVKALLSTDDKASSASQWMEQARAATVFAPDKPAGQAIDEAIDRLQAIRYRRHFYRAVTAYDLEGALRSLAVPLAILEFATAKEDAQIGRQASKLAAELAALAELVIELPPDAAVSLEDRPGELAAAIVSLRDALRGG
ncbi:alpha/beta fold hydrolase [Salinibacterium sp. ZJ450]|uniref:alpha/beta fold hydrolase n=1 Tax=Salinibacterium sp. ZJ450 TaxID=2708338 RepID=UPI0014221DEF|nr:alpha/beta hydrolase [Salinibacterium sp. ZJ450]